MLFVPTISLIFALGIMSLLVLLTAFLKHLISQVVILRSRGLVMVQICIGMWVLVRRWSLWFYSLSPWGYQNVLVVGQAGRWQCWPSVSSFQFPCSFDHLLWIYCQDIWTLWAVWYLCHRSLCWGCLVSGVFRTVHFNFTGYEGHSLCFAICFFSNTYNHCLLQFFLRNPPQPEHVWPSSQTSCLWHPSTLTGVCPKWRARRMLGHLRRSETAFPSPAFWWKGTKTSHRVNMVSGWPAEHHWRYKVQSYSCCVPAGIVMMEQ